MHRTSCLLALVAVLAGCAEERERRSAALPRDGGRGGPSSPDAGGASRDGGPVNRCTDGPRKPRAQRLSIVNGTREPTFVPLAADQVMAVVALGTSRGGAFCSGTLIGDRVVLTAQHCTAGVAATSIEILFGVDDLRPVLAVPVTAKVEHRTRDAALLTLAYAPSSRIAVRPIPIYLGTLTRADEGATVEQAGYGETESSEWGRFFVTELLESVGDTTFTVNGFGRQGVCFGDSGGPSLMTTAEGDVRVIGDLSEGDPECGNRDHFVRADAIRPWIESVTGPTPPAGPLPCGEVSAEGACTEGGSAATYCDDGALVHEPCQDVCGWSGIGWRCVPRTADPCGGLSHLGECAGRTARWCDRGTIQTRDCGACGETCLFLGDRVGFDCEQDPSVCGELDFLGRCDGDVAEWCNEDTERERVDCAAQGQVCRYIDARTGYYCADR